MIQTTPVRWFSLWATAALTTILIIVGIASIRTETPVCDATLRFLAECHPAQKDRSPKRLIDDIHFWREP